MINYSNWTFDWKIYSWNFRCLVLKKFNWIDRAKIWLNKWPYSFSWLTYDTNWLLFSTQIVSISLCCFFPQDMYRKALGVLIGLELIEPMLIRLYASLTFLLPILLIPEEHKHIHAYSWVNVLFAPLLSSFESALSLEFQSQDRLGLLSYLLTLTRSVQLNLHFSIPQPSSLDRGCGITATSRQYNGRQTLDIVKSL